MAKLSIKDDAKFFEQVFQFLLLGRRHMFLFCGYFGRRHSTIFAFLDLSRHI